MFGIAGISCWSSGCFGGNPGPWRCSCSLRGVDGDEILAAVSRSLPGSLNLPVGRGGTAEASPERWDHGQAGDLQPELGIALALLSWIYLAQPHSSGLLFNSTAVPVAPFKSWASHGGIEQSVGRQSPCPEENSTGTVFSGDLIIILTTLSKITKLILKKFSNS